MRVYGHTTTAMHDMSTLPPPPRQLYIYVGHPPLPRCRTGIPRALRASRPFYRHEVDRFVCFFRCYARVPRPHSEGLPGGLLEGSCGRRKHRSTRNRLNVGTFMPASECEALMGRLFEKNFDCTHDSREQYDMRCVYYPLIIYF